MAEEKDIHYEYVEEKAGIAESRNIFKKNNQTKEQKKSPTIDQRVKEGDVPASLPSDAGIFHRNVRQKRIFYKKAEMAL